MPNNRGATSSQDIFRSSMDSGSLALRKFPKRSSTLETVLSGEALSTEDVVTTPITIENDSFSDSGFIFELEADPVNRGPGKGRKMIVLIAIIILFLLIIIGVLAAVGDFKKDPPAEIHGGNDKDGNGETPGVDVSQTTPTSSPSAAIGTTTATPTATPTAGPSSTPSAGSTPTPIYPSNWVNISTVSPTSSPPSNMISAPTMTPADQPAGAAIAGQSIPPTISTSVNATGVHTMEPTPPTASLPSSVTGAPTMTPSDQPAGAAIAGQSTPPTISTSANATGVNTMLPTPPTTSFPSSVIGVPTMTPSDQPAGAAIAGQSTLPTISTSANATSAPTIESTNQPTGSTTVAAIAGQSTPPTISTSANATGAPTMEPTPPTTIFPSSVIGTPIMTPTDQPAGGAIAGQSTPPTISTSANATSAPNMESTNQPAGSTIAGQPPPLVTYIPGLLTVEENGLLLSQGLTSRIIARSGTSLQFPNGIISLPFHYRPDFAATFAVPYDAINNQGGWVYVSNSEMKEQGQGGVGAITFDKDGNAINYSMLLEGTTMNCAGGKTPWETWVSCEEVGEIGEIYQVDPFGRRAPEKLTMSTIQGGRYESFAYDDRILHQPRFYVTEDQQDGPTRRWTPSPESVDWNNPWGMLHGNGTLEYLVMTPDGSVQGTGTYEWVSGLEQSRTNAELVYPGSEGIDRKDNFLYIVTKTEKSLFVLDLDSNTYARSSTAHGLFDGGPDQMQRLLNGIDDIVYFNEDQGNMAGIHGRNREGQFFTILEAPGWSIETTGLAWSPSGKYMYFALQEDGVIFEVTREDGYPFQGMTLDVRYHNKPSDALR